MISVSNCAFYKCESLSSIIISEGVSHLGGYLFSNCKSLKSIYIPNSVSSFDGFDPDGWRIRTFGYCDSLVSIFIPKGTLEKFERLLPVHKNLLHEIPYVDNNWKLINARLLSEKELATINSAKVIETKNGLSVSFSVQSGYYSNSKVEIPLSNHSLLKIGDDVDVKKVKLLLLRRDNDEITKILE